MGYFYDRIRKSDDGQTITFKSGVKLAFEDAANQMITCGIIGTAESISATGTFVPMSIHLSVAADAADSTVGTAYFKVVTAAAMVGQIANVMVRTIIRHNVFDAYGVQSHLVFGASATVSTTDANAHLTALSAKVTFDTSTVTKGWVNAGLFIIEGAGTCSQICHGVSIVEETASTGCQSLLHLYTDVGTTPYISFSGADGTGKSIYMHTAAGTQHGTIKVLINGVAKWLPVMAAE